MENQLITLTKNLISLPSYIDKNNDESAMLLFLEKFFRDNFPLLSIEKQYIDTAKKRYNIIVKGKRNPKLFILGHVDTVQPKDGWTTSPCVPFVKNGSIYGLGASDMKGSLAAFLTALLIKKTEIDLDSLFILLYVDEEYDFKGMKTFIENINERQLTPKMILSLDGELKIASGCRGLIEMSMQIRGKSGHSSNQQSGVNAITQTINLFKTLEQKRCRDTEPYLGKSTMNIAYLQGGTIQAENNNIRWQRAANIIPDFVDVTIEIRPSRKEINATTILSDIQVIAKQIGLTIEKATIQHDIKPWQAQYNKPEVAILKQIYHETKIPFRKSYGNKRGYVDLQMITEHLSSSAFIIGTGGENKHGANECVSIENIKKSNIIYQKVLEKFL